MVKREKAFFFLIDHIVCLFELPLHNRTHTHTHGDDYHTPYYGCTDNCLAPTGLPIHCNPSNTLNFHFKQKLNRQKTQGSILLPPLFFPPASCFFFFFFRRFLPRVPTTCSTPSAFVKFNIRMIDDARAKRANRKSPESAILKRCWTETVDINPCVSQR